MEPDDTEILNWIDSHPDVAIAANSPRGKANQHVWEVKMIGMKEARSRDLRAALREAMHRNP